MSDETQVERKYGGENRPDPSPLTTQQILREISTLEKFVDMRATAIEKAIELAHDNLTRVPTDVQKAVASLQALIDSKLRTLEEKFNSIQTQFSERDVRTEQTARDSKVAVDAALQAAKEAVSEQNKSSALAIAKSETATTKQIDQLGVLITATREGFVSSIEDLKERIGRIENLAAGRVDQRTESRAGFNSIVGIVGLIASIVGLVIGHFLTR